MGDHSPVEGEHTYEPGDEQDEEKRREYVGGSDAGAILGVNRYRSTYETYLIKLGMYEPYDSPELQEAGYFGHRFEPLILSEYARRERVSLSTPHGDISPDGVIVPNPLAPDAFEIADPERPWRRAHPDAFEFDENGEVVGIVDAKLRSPYVRDRWPDGDMDPSVAAQGTHYAGILHQHTGEPVPFHAAVLWGGQRYERYTLTWDDDRHAHLLEREEWFWSCVQERRPPPVDAFIDPKVLDRLYARESGEIIPATPGLERMAERLKRAQLATKNAKAAEDAIKAGIKASMREATEIEGDGGWSIKWRRPKPSPKVDYEAALVEFRNDVAIGDVAMPSDQSLKWVLDKLDEAIENHTGETNPRRRFDAYLNKLDVPPLLETGE